MRTLISSTPTMVGQTVIIKGWVNSVRSHGTLSFADIRDRSGVIQVVGGKELGNLKVEDVVEIEGVIKNRDEKYFNDKIITGKIELEQQKLTVVEKALDLPFDIHQPDLNVSLPVLLDHRPASLRHKKVADVFKMQSTIVSAFRQYLDENGFTEVFVPTIVAGSTEGGSEVFPVDYFGHQAYLAQSPQLYKQVMTSIFERVYTVAHAYRAEPSVTTRHLTEYVGLDVEFGFIDSWQDVVKMADSTVKAIFKAVSEKHQDILDEYGVTIPKTVDLTPQIKLKDALELIYQRTGRDVRHELDLDPEGEREICRWALEEHGSELVFITHFFTKKRAWYSYADPENPEETLTLDLIGRGVEWISGGQRISNYQQLQEKIKSRGQNPADFEVPYGQCFKYGMPPEGGFAIGLERITQNILGLENIRQASLFPRDMERVDTRLSAANKKTAPKIDLHQKLLAYLDENQVKYKHLEHQETNTSDESAKARGTTIEQGAKALVMIADNQPILVVLSAANKLDNSAFKKEFDIKDLHMATPEEVVKYSSVVIGAVPPFGNLINLKTYVDQALLMQPEIAFNAGSKTTSVIMSSADFQKLVKPIIGHYGA
ncbi:MAG TPA: aspartate--tRNA(Asn) ligase [Candidatus Woesebacteria bacterium]|nr:aspartate--tRNA(Asn) ligase [Candidatus Woesebacteria bacterium]